MDAIISQKVEQVVKADKVLWVSRPGLIDLHEALGARRGAIAAPQFVTRNAIIGPKVELSPVDNQVVGKAIGLTRIEIFEQKGARRGAITAPQFIAIDAIIGTKVEQPLPGGIVAGKAGIGIADLVQIHKEGRACRGAVGAPKFATVQPIRGLEVELIVEGEKSGWRAIPTKQEEGECIQIFEEHRAPRRAITLPEFDPRAVAVGGKVERAIKDG